jgi:hypothetical protein
MPYAVCAKTLSRFLVRRCHSLSIRWLDDFNVSFILTFGSSVRGSDGSSRPVVVWGVAYLTANDGPLSPKSLPALQRLRGNNHARAGSEYSGAGGERSLREMQLSAGVIVIRRRTIRQRESGGTVQTHYNLRET